MSTYYAVEKKNAYDVQHHGILGQKWGIRRYQNPDGTLTPEGKARYGSVENFKNSKDYAIYKGAKKHGLVGAAVAAAKYSSGGKHKVVKEPTKITEKNETKSKVHSKMTSKEIKSEVARARKEHTYNMEFLESNGDQDPRTGADLKGEALDIAYAKFLKKYYTE